jgi:hypothetical protein
MNRRPAHRMDEIHPIDQDLQKDQIGGLPYDRRRAAMSAAGGMLSSR